jgi:hypothetical protein
LRVCRLKEEKVVKPPQRPSMMNCRVSEPTKSRPSGAVRVATKPMTKEPRRFTRMVPQGKVSPK